jgi:hypothetical protein
MLQNQKNPFSDLERENYEPDFEEVRRLLTAEELNSYLTEDEEINYERIINRDIEYFGDSLATQNNVDPSKWNQELETALQKEREVNRDLRAKVFSLRRELRELDAIVLEKDRQLGNIDYYEKRLDREASQRAGRQASVVHSFLDRVVPCNLNQKTITFIF